MNKVLGKALIGVPLTSNDLESRLRPFGNSGERLKDNVPLPPVAEGNLNGSIIDSVTNAWSSIEASATKAGISSWITVM